MKVKVKIFNEQQLMALAACIGLREENEIYDNKGVLISKKPTYNKQRINYNADLQVAEVECDKRQLAQIKKVYFTILPI